ncbi:MAG: HNH endonuclease [Anaerolineae bacterium]|nr:HNH endonuclease [Anaerolineae bacterium]
MSSVFSHRDPPPFPTNDYRKYRPALREDFHHCCAYCLLPELFAAGESNFEIDHFRPKSLPRFFHLINEYTNLYYSCHPCNHSKHKYWPSEKLEREGYTFVDMCKDSFSTHFRDNDGIWEPLTNAGKYTIERLRLNKDDLVELRRYIADMRKDSGAPPLNWDSPSHDQIRGRRPVESQS